MTRVPNNRRTLAVSCAIVASLAVVGCGSDGDDATDVTVAAGATTESTGTFDLAAYCDAEVSLETAASDLGDPSEDPAGFANALLPLALASAGAAPIELEATFAQRVTTLQAAAGGTGDLSALFAEGEDPVHAYDAANCGWNQASVTLEDYHFTGLPETLPAGDYNFDVTNTGTEFHVLVIVERAPGETRSFDEILADPAAETAVVTKLGAAAAPGESGYGIARLAPGEYLAVCPVPTGSTPGVEGTGAPHFTAGMTQIINVTG